VWLALFGLFGYSFWSQGIGTGFTVLAEFVAVTLVAGVTIIPKSDSPYFVKAVYGSMVRRVADYAKEGDKILDTHLGSGSSRISAWKAGLDFTACELDADYFAAQEKRFKEFTAQLRLF
jgi:hypothetical protein